MSNKAPLSRLLQLSLLLLLLGTLYHVSPTHDHLHGALVNDHPCY
jgi:hypothetical protein